MILPFFYKGHHLEVLISVIYWTMKQTQNIFDIENIKIHEKDIYIYVSYISRSENIQTS